MVHVEFHGWKKYDFHLHSTGGKSFYNSMDGKIVPAQAEPLNLTRRIEIPYISIDGTIVYFPSIE
jgi:outer membrane protease